MGQWIKKTEVKDVWVPDLEDRVKDLEARQTYYGLILSLGMRMGLRIKRVPETSGYTIGPSPAHYEWEPIEKVKDAPDKNILS